MTDCNQVNWCLEILKVMPTFIVGCIAAHISWQQSKTAKEQSQIAKAKLNLDLFNRRLAIFEETWSAASSVMRSNEPVPPPVSMTNLYPEAYFLFGSDVEEYMKELAKKMTELSIIRQITIKITSRLLIRSLHRVSLKVGSAAQLWRGFVKPLVLT